MLLENLVTRFVSEENVYNSSLTRRVTKQGRLLLAALVLCSDSILQLAVLALATVLSKKPGLTLGC